jgi:hypothetical protein
MAEDMLTVADIGPSHLAMGLFGLLVVGKAVPMVMFGSAVVGIDD